MLNKKEILNYLSANKKLFRERYFVDKIGLIGSFARGDDNNDSDVDLVVYFLPEAKNNRMFRLYYDLQTYISLSLNKKVDIITNGKVLPVFQDLINNEIEYV